MDIFEIIGSIIVIGIVLFFLYYRFGPELRRRAITRAERREQFGDEYDRFKDDHNNPYIPDFLEMHPGRSLALAFTVLALLIVLSGSFVTIPAGHRGVLLTWGKVEDRILPEGLSFKLPMIQSVELMSVQIQKVESTEAAASHDLQDVSTTVAVNYRLKADAVNKIYQTLQHDYADRVIKPNIEESLKAATAMYTAEELITKREMMKGTFGDIIDDRLAVFDIEVIAVSLTNFQFSKAFSDAIEAKVTAEQHALEAKNKLEQIRYEAQQQIIQAEAEKNATIARAEGEARKEVIAAEALAQKIMLEANATANAINVITEQMTPEYAQYLYLQQWSGNFPTTMLGDIEDLGLIIQTP